MFGIDDAVAAVSTLANTAITRIWPDATEIEKAKLDAIAKEMQGDLSLLVGQLDINKIEAASSSVFVSGWRPFIGWVCGFGLAYASILDPVARFLATVIFGYVGIFPVIDTTITMQVMMGMLGLAGMRTFEKHKGVSSK